MMTLDEAIAHSEEKAGDCSTECRREHRQLARWLRELKMFRDAPSQQEVLGELLTIKNRLEEIESKIPKQLLIGPV